MLNQDNVLLIDGESTSVYVEEDDEHVYTYCKKIGDLHLPTGEINACDPFLDLLERPFTKHVQPRTYPVLVNIACFQYERIAFAILKFSENKVTQWEMTLGKGEHTERKRRSILWLLH